MVGAAATVGRRGQGVLAMLAFGAVALLAVALAGRSGTAPPGRVALIGAINLTDDDGDTALFAAAELGPGSSVTRCLRVTYSGPGGTGPVRLLATGLSGPLLAHLTVRVDVGTGGGFAGCGGFSGLQQRFAHAVEAGRRGLLAAGERSLHERPDSFVRERRHLLLKVSRPVGAISIEIADTGRNFGIAGGEFFHKASPAIGERLCFGTSRVFSEHRFHIAEKFHPLARDAFLQLG